MRIQGQGYGADPMIQAKTIVADLSTPHACPVNEPGDYDDKNINDLDAVDCADFVSGLLIITASNDLDEAWNKGACFSIAEFVGGAFKRYAVPCGYIGPGMTLAVKFPISPAADALRVRAWRCGDANAVTITAATLKLSTQPFNDTPWQGMTNGIQASVDTTTKPVLCTLTKVASETGDVRMESRNYDAADNAAHLVYHVLQEGGHTGACRHVATSYSGISPAAASYTTAIDGAGGWDAWILVAAASANTLDNTSASVSVSRAT
jgi:hypothetical protein